MAAQVGDPDDRKKNLYARQLDLEWTDIDGHKNAAWEVNDAPTLKYIRLPLHRCATTAILA